MATKKSVKEKNLKNEQKNKIFPPTRPKQTQ
jgi:hypothetical protein